MTLDLSLCGTTHLISNLWSLTSRLLQHSVHNLNIARNNLLLRFLSRLLHLRCYENLIIRVNHVTDAVAVQTEHVKAAREFVIDDIFDDVIDGVVNALDHAGQNKPGLDHVLVRSTPITKCVARPLGSLPDC